MNNQESFVAGLIAGAGMMYLLDPDRGARRRNLIRDQVVHGAHELEDLGEEVGSRARHLRNRAYGAVAETRGRLRQEEVDDRVLRDRVRSELGRLVSAPGTIEVTADDGRVVLTGSVGESEVDALLSGVEGVRGVREVVNRLNRQGEDGSTAHEESGTSLHPA